MTARAEARRPDCRTCSGCGEGAELLGASAWGRLRESWQLGFIEDSYEGVNNANESTAAQLPDGRLYFNARNQKGSSPGNRLDAYSRDGGASLDRGYAPQSSLTDVPLVQGSVLQPAGDEHDLLFSAPSVPTDRAAMALWSSKDGGRSFGKALTLSKWKAGYSDLVQIDSEMVGVLDEAGTRTAYESIEFRRVAFGNR
ncbi:exo-alpha-sialidase [Streptomyces sp. NPDC003832]